MAGACGRSTRLLDFMPKWIALVGMLGVITAANAKEVWLSWPAEYLRPSHEMNIVEVKLTIECGEVRAVRSIPSDWNVRVTRPVSAQAEFSAEAGHGASNLPNLRQLESVIGIAVEDKRCFNVSAHIIELGKEHALSKAQLKLRQRPAK